MLARPRGSVIL
jgi:hypothetical protein